MIRSCDTMVALGSVTASRQTLFAKNSDRPAEECQPLVQNPRVIHNPGAVARCQFVEVPETGVSYAHVGSRPYWCWGYEQGVNEHQVVIGNEGLNSRFEFSEPKLIGMEILRFGLERGRTAGEAVDVMTGLISRFGQGRFQGNIGAGNYDNGYLVADPNEAYVIEAAGHEWAVQKVTGSVGISNVYSIGTDWIRVSPDAERQASKHGWWTGEGLNFADAFSEQDASSRAGTYGGRRRTRSCTLLSQKAGELDVSTMMAILADHSTGHSLDEPFCREIEGSGGICMHHGKDGSGGNTAASLVADLCADGSRLPIYWCSFYSPCLGIFVPLFAEGTVPPELALGGAEPDEHSPWWLFHDLARAAMAIPGSGVPALREQWRPVQEELLESAYPVAREARHLMDRGEEAAARRLVSDRMARDVGNVLHMGRELLRTL